MQSPILLIAPATTSDAIIRSVQEELKAPSLTVSSRREGLVILRRQQVSLIVLDDSLSESDPFTADILFQTSGAAPLLEISFSRQSAAKIARQVRSTLSRQRDYQARAERAAKELLKRELRASLSGILLGSELALREARPEQRPTLRELVDLAGGLRDQLQF